MKPTLIKEKVTLESIARSIENLATKKEVDKLATKDQLAILIVDVSKIDDRLSLMDKRFDAIDGKLFEFTGRFSKINDRFDVLERKVDRMKDDFINQLDYLNIWSPTRIEFTTLDDRVKKVEKKLKINT